MNDETKQPLEQQQSQSKAPEQEPEPEIKTDSEATVTKRRGGFPAGAKRCPICKRAILPDVTHVCSNKERIAERITRQPTSEEKLAADLGIDIKTLLSPDTLKALAASMAQGILLLESAAISYTRVRKIPGSDWRKSLIPPSKEEIDAHAVAISLYVAIKFRDAKPESLAVLAIALAQLTYITTRVMLPPPEVEK